MWQTRRMGQNTMSGMQSAIRHVVCGCRPDSYRLAFSRMDSDRVVLIENSKLKTVTALPTPKFQRESSCPELFLPASATE